MPTIAFTTLGCRVNQYDTDSMRSLFFAEGFTETDFNGRADVYVINTCSVTHMGEKKSRQIIRRAKKNNEGALVVVTGCYAQLSPDVLAAIPDVDAVIGTNERKNIVTIVRSLLGRAKAEAVLAVHDVMGRDTFEEIPLYPSAVEHTRADLKIQEGCNNFCSYCIIPYTRGSLKSRRPDAVIAEAKRLVSFGFREIVLTGIHLGAYGIDLPERPTLALILRRLLAETDVARIRMGSIESVEISDDLIDAINSSPRVCPHLHLPIQSGSDAILSAMHRRYTTEEYINLVRRLHEKVHGLTVSTDLILGFPGETDERFAETVKALEQLNFSHIHAFPYSPRQGTPAAVMAGQVSGDVKKKRVEQINAMSVRQKEAILDGMIGQEGQVLLESVENAMGEGFSEHYERVRAEVPADYECGRIINVLLTGRDGSVLTGNIKEVS